MRLKSRRCMDAMNDRNFRQGAGTMAKIDLNKVPRFSELPIKPDKPKESSWGVFGDDDELGCLNFLTPEGVIEAARLVRKGSVFRLDTKINYAKPPQFRVPLRTVFHKFAAGHQDCAPACPCCERPRCHLFARSSSAPPVPDDSRPCRRLCR